MNGLKPYPAYRDSGVPWLGQVPVHWDVRRLKRIARLNPSKSEAHHILRSGGQATFLPMERVGIEGRVDPQDLRDVASVWAGFTYFRRGDVLVAKITPCFENGKGACLDDLPTPIGFGSTEFHVLRALPTVFPRYLYRISSLSTFRRMGADAMTGAAGQQRVPENFVSSFPAPAPPLPEQAAIVRFLDHVDRRTRRYIRTKKKLVALLNEEKQAIINRAVTCGLDPDVRLKPSGIDWLGDVPEHWKVRRLKYVVTPMEQGWSPQCDAQPAADDEWGVLKVGCVNGNSFDAAQNKKLPSGLQPVSALEITDGDILVSRANTRELLGLAALATAPRHRLILCDKLFRFRARADKADPAFLVHSIRGKTSRAQIESSTNGASDSMQNIGQSVVRNLFVSMPPIEEQKAIVVAIAEQTQSIQASVTRAERQIALMREYRTRLIADVVTGKLDVREAAANLPDEPEDLEPIEQGDTLSESGSEDDRAESEGTIEDGP